MSPGDLGRLAVTQTSGKRHQLKAGVKDSQEEEEKSEYGVLGAVSKNLEKSLD